MHKKMKTIYNKYCIYITSVHYVYFYPSNAIFKRKSVKFDWYEREIINGITVYITW